MAVNTQGASGRRRVKSSFFLRGRRELVIVHDKQEYLLGTMPDGSLSLVKRDANGVGPADGGESA
ncbi:MAG TPA: hypothetical protein VGH16_18615 [Candidatus Binatia bacterium]|jgi:hemin uptake protein HemP